MITVPFDIDQTVFFLIMGGIVEAEIDNIEVSAKGIRLHIKGYGWMTPDQIRLSPEDLLTELEEVEQKRHQLEMLQIEKLAMEIKRRQEAEK